MATEKVLYYESSYAEGMQAYLDALTKQAETSADEAREDAIEALIATGVFNSDGTPKDKIVSWE